MKELLMHCAVNRDRYIDLWDSQGKHLMNRKPISQSVLDDIQRLLQQESLKAATFRKDGSLWVDRQDFTLTRTVEAKPIKETPSANNSHSQNPTKSEMADQELHTKLILLQSENEWLKKNHDKLERENGDLRVNNEKLRIENNDLSVKNATSEKEKELALRYQEANTKTGLGKLGTPDEIKEIMAGVGELIKSIKNDGSTSVNQIGSGPGITGVKQEVLQFISSRLGELSEEEAQQLAYIFKTLIDEKKISYVFNNWTGNTTTA